MLYFLHVISYLLLVRKHAIIYDLELMFEAFKFEMGRGKITDSNLS